MDPGLRPLAGLLAAGLTFSGCFLPVDSRPA
jgi:hypothetical protein